MKIGFGYTLRQAVCALFCTAVVVGAPAAAAGDAVTADTKSAAVRAGWIEDARVFPGGLRYTAKLDSGATHSAVFATAIERFEKNDGNWVRFTLTAIDGTAKSYELPLVRVSRTRDINGPAIRREVVRLTVCVGDVRAETEVNLSDRNGFNHALLLGRSFLRGRFLVDSGTRHLHKLNCGEG